MADAKRGGLSRRRGVKTRAEQGRGFTLKERVTPLLAERDSGRKDGSPRFLSRGGGKVEGCSNGRRRKGLPLCAE
jgi:hypothetical protein